MKIPCGIIKDILPLYHDGVCGEESRQAVREHLEDCESCREELRLMDGGPDVGQAGPEGEPAAQAALTAWKRGKRRSFLKGLALALGAVALLAVAWSQLFIVAEMQGGSMLPTMASGDVCLFRRADNVSLALERGDIVYVRVRLAGVGAVKDIARIVAVPGDRVRIEDGTLYVNDEPSGLYPAGTVEAVDMEGEVALGEDEYFVMGDDQEDAVDSRDERYGLVSRTDILGRYLLTLLRQTGSVSFSGSVSVEADPVQP